MRFTRVRLVVDTSTKAVVYKTADFHKPWNDRRHARPGDPGARSTSSTPSSQPILGTVIGELDGRRSRAPTCAARADGRLCESLVGNVVTDAMRTKYASIGVDFAITNSGGLRDRLTCPAAGGGSGLLPGRTRRRRT